MDRLPQMARDVGACVNTKPLTFAEGKQRGKEDKAARKTYDPHRWVHAWARDFWRFEQGYAEGFYS